MFTCARTRCGSASAARLAPQASRPCSSRAARHRPGWAVALEQRPADGRVAAGAGGGASLDRRAAVEAGVRSLVVRLRSPPPVLLRSHASLDNQRRRHGFGLPFLGGHLSSAFPYPASCAAAATSSATSPVASYPNRKRIAGSRGGFMWPPIRIFAIGLFVG